MHLKSEFGWLGARETHQTSNGANGYGLNDMAGNVWEWCFDWYGRDYYASSPAENPKGPENGTPMPDGEPYRVLRGGNWYNGRRGEKPNEIHDGHSRVSNRNPSYYRAPDDPNHAWYHIGFRVVSNFRKNQTGVHRRFDCEIHQDFTLMQNYPNPFNPTTMIQYQLFYDGVVRLTVHNLAGQIVKTLADDFQSIGHHKVNWHGTDKRGNKVSSGVYFYRLETDKQVDMNKMILAR